VADLSRRLPRLRMLLLAGGLAAAVGLTAQATGVLQAAEQASVDHRFAARKPAPPRDLVVIGVDDVTFSELGVQWPFPRSVFARAVTQLHRAGVRDIVFDVQFTEPTRPREDMALYDAIGRAGGAVMATSESDGRGHTNVLGGDRNLRRIHAIAAASNFPDETGGAIRRITPEVANLRTIAVATARRAGARVDLRRMPAGGAYIDYRGPAGTVPTVSLSRLVRGRVDPARLRGRIAVIGTTAPSLHDLHPTSAGTALMSGPEVQADAIWTTLHDFPLAAAPEWLDALAVLVLALLVPLVAVRVRPVIAALAAPAVGAAYWTLTQLAFEQGLVIGAVAPLLALAVATVATVVVSHVLETFERQRADDLNTLLEGEVRATELEIVQRLVRAVESRDEETGGHIERIARLTRRLAEAAGLSREEAQLIGRASAMHDVGKIAIPDGILRKPGPLDDHERAIIESHATVGAELLSGSRSGLVRRAEEIARTHHERWDGTGYPAGLAGEEIPLAGRICALCDVFDALISDRPYKRAWPVADALREIADQSGRHFDPRLVELFLGLDLGYSGVTYAPESPPSTRNVDALT
jgi:HD-GYP domain-containing protein (c-di-GMP phosphodiesterase class II)